MGLRSKNEFFIDTDVIAMHLEGKSDLLINATSSFTCYTSVINSSEIFSISSNEDYLLKCKKAFFGLNILGIPYRYSDSIGKLLNFIKKKLRILP